MGKEVPAEEPDPSADPRWGRDEIGGWKLVRELSRGGMGQVWKAIRFTGVGESKLGALKLPLVAAVTDPNRVEAFKAEARLTMKLDHPNIVKTLDAGVDRGIPFMVMEWVNGVDLAEFMRILRKSAPLALDVGIHIFSELVLALRYAHSRRIAGQTLAIIHRDIKPSNVMISSDGAVLLTDFGIAHVAGERSSENIRGTLRYMAPEHWMGRPSQRSDLYSLGLILTELLDGKQVYAGLTEDEIIGRKMTGAIPPCRPADLPSQIEAIRVGLLQVEEQKRIQSADDVLSTLELAPPFRKATVQLQKLFALLFADTAARSGYTEVLRPGQSSTRISPELAAMFAAVEAMRIQGIEPDADLAQAVEARSAAELSGNEPEAAVATASPLAPASPPAPASPHVDVEPRGALGDLVQRARAREQHERDTDAPQFYRRRPGSPGDALAEAPSPAPVDRAPEPAGSAVADRTVFHGHGETPARVTTERWGPTPAPVSSEGREPTPKLRPQFEPPGGQTEPAPSAEPGTIPPGTDAAAAARADEVTTSTWSGPPVPLPTRLRWLAVRSNRLIWAAVVVATVVLVAIVVGRYVIAPWGAADREAADDDDSDREAAASTVDVLLKLDSIDHAEVKIGSHTFELTQSEDVQVAAGIHRVSWRATASDPWIDAGEIDLSPGRRHQLRVGKSGERGIHHSVLPGP